MRLRRLPNSDRSTTPLGFGCAYLVAGFEQSKSTRLVHAVMDAGIRHFDVAPIYGMGTAEDALGLALTGRRSEVTITSKAGLTRPNISNGMMLARALAAPLRRYLSKLTRSLGRNVMGRPHEQFSVSSIERSLFETLRRLKTDYLDVFLLHDPQPEHLSDELLKFMENLRHKGISPAIGVASGRDACQAILSANPDFFDVFQYAWCALDPRNRAISTTSFIITHRAVLNALQPTSDWFADNPEARKRLSSATGCDLGSKNALAEVLLGAALAESPSGIVLASSRNVKRVSRFGQVMCDERIQAAGTAFIAGLSSENCRPIPVDDSNARLQIPAKEINKRKEPLAGRPNGIT